MLNSNKRRWTGSDLRPIVAADGGSHDGKFLTRRFRLEIHPSEREFGPVGSLSIIGSDRWFIVGFASELAPGQVKWAHYFGEELVIFRTESGRSTCSTPTAAPSARNIGVGGTVEGERIVCPWHGWRLERRRHHALIPYSKIGRKQNVRIQTYHSTGVVRLHPGVARAPRPRAVLVTAGAARARDRQYYPLHPHTRMVNRVKVHAQMIIENAADPYHVQYVHKAANPATHRLVRGQRLPPARDRERELRWRRAKTWLTPNGPSTPRSSMTTTRSASGWCGSVRLVATVAGDRRARSTRTTPTTSIPRPRSANPATPATSRRAARRSSAAAAGSHQQDFFTWENMKYLEKPNLAPRRRATMPRCGGGRIGSIPAPSRRRTTSGTPPTVSPTRRQRGCDAPPAGWADRSVGVRCRTLHRPGGARPARRAVRRPRDDVDRRHPSDVRADARRSCAAANVLRAWRQRGETVALFTGTCPNGCTSGSVRRGSAR